MLLCYMWPSFSDSQCKIGSAVCTQECVLLTDKGLRSYTPATKRDRIDPSMQHGSFSTTPVETGTAGIELVGYVDTLEHLNF